MGKNPGSNDEHNEKVEDKGAAEMKRERQRQRAKQLSEKVWKAMEDPKMHDDAGFADRLDEVEALVYSSDEDVLRKATDVLAFASMTVPEVVVAEMQTDILLLRLAELRFWYCPNRRDDSVIHETTTIAIHYLSEIHMP